MSALPSRALLRTQPHLSDAQCPTSHRGRGLTVTGSLETEGELRIHGKVLGQIRADRLVIEKGGAVEGDMVARDAHIGGRLNGRGFAVNGTVDDSAEGRG